MRRGCADVRPGWSCRLRPGGERSFLTDRGVADSSGAVDASARLVSRVDASARSLLFVAACATRRSGSIGHRHAPCHVASFRLTLLRAIRCSRWVAVRPSQLLARAAPDVLFANEDEIAVVVDAGDQKALAKLAPVVVIKQGAAGCRLVWRGGRWLGRPSVVATRRIAATDTTGAGDAFDAGFLFALLSGGYRRDMKA